MARLWFLILPLLFGFCFSKAELFSKAYAENSSLSEAERRVLKRFQERESILGLTPPRPYNSFTAPEEAFGDYLRKKQLLAADGVKTDIHKIHRDIYELVSRELIKFENFDEWKRCRWIKPNPTWMPASITSPVRKNGPELFDGITIEVAQGPFTAQINGVEEKNHPFNVARTLLYRTINQSAVICNADGYETEYAIKWDISLNEWERLGKIIDQFKHLHQNAGINLEFAYVKARPTTPNEVQRVYEQVDTFRTGYSETDIIFWGQELIKNKGFDIKVDGDFGPASCSTLKKALKKQDTYKCGDTFSASEIVSLIFDAESVDKHSKSETAKIDWANLHKFRTLDLKINGKLSKTFIAIKRDRKDLLSTDVGLFIFNGEECEAWLDQPRTVRADGFSATCASGLKFGGGFSTNEDSGITDGQGRTEKGERVRFTTGAYDSVSLEQAKTIAQNLTISDTLITFNTAQKGDNKNKLTDNQVPSITISAVSADDRRGSITGRVIDNIAVAEVRVDGAIVPLKPNGSFAWQGFVPTGGLSVTVEAIDTAGLSAVKQVRLERGQLKQATGPSFARLDPFRGKTARKNKNALALVIGVADYKYTSDPALYADKDAEYFNDYAAIKLGVPDNNIFTITNTEADEVSIKKAVKNWLLRMSAKDKTDVYVFFAGHGLASSDGSNMFLLPYDGDPELLEDSAIDRKQLFADIQAISPRSVTVFLDSCYSGGTRAGGTLVASLRPIAIRAKEQNVPDGFTILSAAKGDQTSQSLEEAKHGLFSYFLMRGLEGDADANNDNQITAGELHSFVTDKVERQSGFKQTPDLQGDADRVLVRFQ